MSPAMQTALATIERTARHTAFHRVKQIARKYRRHPLQMGVIDARLPFAHPRQMVAIGEHLVEAASRSSGGLVQMAPVGLTNARAVALLGRWERRYARQIEDVV